MSTITLVVDKDKKTQYKEYVNFLDNYKNGKRNDSDISDGYSLTSSGRSSSASVHSEINELPTKSFNEYLHNYTNKKFQSVHPNLNKNSQTKPKSVKTEVFLQVNNKQQSEESNSGHMHVGEIAKVFENSNGKSAHFQQVQQKFNRNAKNQENRNSNNLRLNESNQPKTNNIQIHVKNFNQNETPIVAINGNSSLPAKIEVVFPVNQPNDNKTEVINYTNSQIANTVNGNSSLPAKIEVVFPVNQPQGNKMEIINYKDSQSSPKNVTNVLSKPPVVKRDPEVTAAPPKANLIEIEIRDATGAIPTSPPKEKLIEIQNKDATGTIPPPPPLPPMNSTPSPRIPSSPITVIPNSPKFLNHKSSTLPRMPAEKFQRDTTDSATLNRNDPRVRKVVYGALRNMYGAYHEKANDYLATLPKNRVKKNNGLDSIINSIAAQGGLEKLSGRSKVEAD